MLEYAMDESAKYIKSIFDKLEKKIKLSKIAINIGANDGITLDLLKYLYLEKKFEGVCLEMNEHFLPFLQKNLPNNVKKIIEKATPETINSYLETYNNIDVIGIDIDSYDYFILEKIITLDPKVIIIELNENIPPGIIFYTHYNEKYDYSIHDNYQLFGCSLDAVTELGNKYNYKLLKMEWNNAILIKDSLSNFFELPISNLEAYRDGYYLRENRKKIFYWKGEESKYFDLPLNKAYEAIFTFFKKDLDKITLKFTNL